MSSSTLHTAASTYRFIGTFLGLGAAVIGVVYGSWALYMVKHDPVAAAGVHHGSLNPYYTKAFLGVILAFFGEGFFFLCLWVARRIRRQQTSK